MNANSEARNKTLARRFLEEEVNTCDVSRLTEFLADDFLEMYTDLVGIERARQHLLTFHHCYPDLAVTVEGQVAEDDTVVTWFTMRGTHRGEWGGIKPTNKVLTLRAVNIQRVRDGRIVEQWGGANTLEALLEIESNSAARQHRRVTPAVIRPPGRTGSPPQPSPQARRGLRA